MSHHIGSVHAKVFRGKVTITGMGKTSKGQEYIRDSVALDVESLSDPSFKAAAKAAVKKMLGESRSTG